MDFPGGLDGKVSAYNAGDRGSISLGWEDLLEKEMATHFSILAWKIPWTEEPDALQSMRSKRVGYDLAIKQAVKKGEDSQSGSAHKRTDPSKVPRMGREGYVIYLGLHL